MPAKRNQRLTTQQRALIKGLNQGLTIADAGRKAGYSARQASHTAYKSLRLRFHDVLERANLSVDQILTETIQKQRSKLEAKETKFFAHMGIVGESRDVEAHDIQLQAARDLQRILIVEDHKDATPLEGMGGITINITLDRERRGSQGSDGEADRPAPADRGNARLITVDAQVDENPGRARSG
jgi:hypothetical protein